METRLKNRLDIIRTQLSISGSAVINRWPGSLSDHHSVFRFLHNPRVNIKRMIDEVRRQTFKATKDEVHTLVLQDTCELNYNHINGLLQVNDPHIGLLSDNKSTGFYIHPGLMIDAENSIPLGLSSIQLWNRPFGSPNAIERDYKKLPIEQKTSNRWLKCAEQSRRMVGDQRLLTLVGDRENDIYEFLATVPNDLTHVLIRSSWNRKLANGKQLDQELASVEWQGDFHLSLSGNDYRTKRRAHLAVKWTSVAISKPYRRRRLLSTYPDQVTVQVIKISELADSVPAGEAPIDWRLLTTHPVNTLEQALQIIEWYKWRWFIEDFFRVLKTKGLEVESSQLSSGFALKKLVVLCMEEAFRILLMRQDRLGKANYELSNCFDQQQQHFLKLVDKQQRQQGNIYTNPFDPSSLAWATWIIAIMGGWKPANPAQKPAGVISISRGLKLFRQQFQGWQLAQQYLIQTSKDPPKKVVSRD